MHIVYIDDSHDEKKWVFTGLAVPDRTWRLCLRRIIQFRRRLKKSDGVYIYKEFHAWKFVSGRGKISDSPLSRSRRCELFRDTLRFITYLPDVRLFCLCFDAGPKEDERAFNFLLNRINRTMKSWKSRALLICDEGKELIYTRLMRRMAHDNPVVSIHRYWPETGTAVKNIPIDRIIEDPVFKKSERSYFIQLSDFCAYALLRRESPLPSKTRYGLDKTFEELQPIIVRSASYRDSEGIIRP